MIAQIKFAATLSKMIKEHVPPDQLRVSGEVISLLVGCCSGAHFKADKNKHIARFLEAGAQLACSILLFY
jgi:hypothetical protein